MPDGATLSDYYSKVSPGDNLILATNGSYSLGALENGFSSIPSGASERTTKIYGNGSTITGGITGILLTSKSYIDFYDLNFEQQRNVIVNTGGTTNHIGLYRINGTVKLDTSIDAFKLMPISDSIIEDCTLTGGDADYATVDGFEFWGPCENVVVRRCTAIGFNNGLTDNDGHGFEVYGTSPAEICDNILFVDCHAEGCRIGFTSEGGGDENALHTNIVCESCTGTDNVVADFGGLQGATIYLQDSTGTKTGNVVDL